MDDGSVDDRWINRQIKKERERELGRGSEGEKGRSLQVKDLGFYYA